MAPQLVDSVEPLRAEGHVRAECVTLNLLSG